MYSSFSNLACTSAVTLQRRMPNLRMIQQMVRCILQQQFLLIFGVMVSVYKQGEKERKAQGNALINPREGEWETWQKPDMDSPGKASQQNIQYSTPFPFFLYQKLWNYMVVIRKIKAQGFFLRCRHFFWITWKICNIHHRQKDFVSFIKFTHRNSTKLLTA